MLLLACLPVGYVSRQVDDLRREEIPALFEA